MFFLYSDNNSGKKIKFGVVPPPSMLYADNDGYSSEFLAEDMFKKGMAMTLSSESPPDLHYYLHGTNNSEAYEKLLQMTNANFENSNQNTAYGR